MFGRFKFSVNLGVGLNCLASASASSTGLIYRLCKIYTSG